MRISVSSVATLCSYNPFGDVPELFTELLYQDLPGLLQQDCDAIGAVSQSSEEQRASLEARLDPVAATQLQELRRSILATTESVEEAQRVQQRIAAEAVKRNALSPEEAERLKQLGRHDLYTTFGQRHEEVAIHSYEKRTGWEVYARNDKKLVWPLPSPPVDLQSIHPPLNLTQPALTDDELRRILFRAAENPAATAVLALGELSTSERRFVHRTCESELSARCCVFSLGVPNTRGGRMMVLVRATHLLWKYKDMRGYIQGCFTRGQMKCWYDQGYFNRETVVTCATVMGSFQSVGQVFGVWEPFTADSMWLEGLQGVQASLEQELESWVPQYDDEVSSAYFELVGKVDGICEQPSVTQDGEWQMEQVVVECKNRVRSAKHPPPLYDQIQLVIYCIMLRCNAGDLVQYVKANTERLVVSRVCLDDHMNHRKAFFGIILPRLYTVVDAIMSLRSNVTRRQQWLLALASGRVDDVWSMLVEMVPHFDEIRSNQKELQSSCIRHQEIIKRVHQ